MQANISLKANKQKDLTSKKKSEGTMQTMPLYFRNGKYLKYHAPTTSVEHTGQQPIQKKIISPKKAQDNKKILIIGFIIVVLLAGVGGYLFWTIRNNTATQDTELQAQLEAERQKQEDLRRQQEEADRQNAQVEQERLEKEARIQRDEQRIKDIVSIQQSLENYYNKSGKYPDNVIAGASISYDGEVFLDSVPLDPADSNTSYSYNVAPLDNLSYTLSFTLEQGLLSLNQGLLTVSSERQLQEDGTILDVPTKRTEGSKIKLFLPSLDTDQDGLTDVEETLLYTTDKDEFDSDFDTYSDKQELLNLYNPFGNAPITLLDSGNVEEYKNDSFTYAIYYPKKWVYKALDGSNREVIFTSTTGEFIEVLIEDSILDETLKDWYVAQYGQDKYDLTQAVFTHKNILEGLRSPDRKTVYFKRNGLIYVITYNTGNKELVDYGVTFEMMVKSFRLLPLENNSTDSIGASTNNSTDTNTSTADSTQPATVNVNNEVQ